MCNYKLVAYVRYVGNVEPANALLYLGAALDKAPSHIGTRQVRGVESGTQIEIEVYNSPREDSQKIINRLGGELRRNKIHQVGRPKFNGTPRLNGTELSDRV